MTIAERIDRITKTLPNGVKLVAVSKTKPISDILAAYNSGQRLFGENKALEMRDKHALLPADIRWHFIGHLQRNKVKYIAPFVSVIHSVDSPNLLTEINKEATKNHRKIDCLLQIRLSNEETKYGMEVSEARTLLASEAIRELPNVQLCGVMGIGSITEDKSLTRKEFAALAATFREFKQRFFADNEAFCEISMGMSDDYCIAVEEGSTIIRIGSTIFGSRTYL
ncbi:MAG: YggS family pyridoxal phosphate-dependent enzyme [Bacteroidales bacterium]|jgi:pyridoxal phosphate enzyme (YggS family)|nr:YggS family pyridoxal phosphate-dependent enzyme [Bacteroidales bacterium]